MTRGAVSGAHESDRVVGEVAEAERGGQAAVERAAAAKCKL